MKTLYVIGNGFDIHHGLNTRYQLFADYLAENNEDIYDLLLNYYGLPDIKSFSLSDEEYALWSRFEEALAELDYKTVLEDNRDLIANPASEDFRDRDWHAFQIQMEEVINQLTTRLIDAFNQFILAVDYPEVESCSLLHLDEGSVFLSFNYTETLQRIYGIPDEKICYIHEKAGNETSNLILGHGIDPDSFIEPEEKPPVGLSEEELREWYDWKANEYDYSFQSAKDELLRYYTEAFKDTISVIHEHEDFFSNLSGVSKIVVLGHSISDVDMNYFKELKERVSKNVDWIASYYSDWEKQKHLEALVSLGIDEDKIEQIQMKDLLVNHAESTDEEGQPCNSEARQI